jgi:Mrp family chromosome partitioning ATPase
MSSSNDHFDLRQFLRPLLRFSWLIAAVVAAAVLLTYHHYKNESTTWKASTLLYQQSSPTSVATSSGKGSGGASATAVTTGTASDAAVLATSAEVARTAARALHYHGLLHKLVQQITANPLNTTGKTGQVSQSNFLTIGATAGSRRYAESLADHFAHALITVQNNQAKQATTRALDNARSQLSKVPATPDYLTERQDLQAQIAQLETLVASPSPSGLHQVNPPVASATPPKPTRNAVFAGVIALVLMTALVLAVSRLDKRIRSVDDLGAAYDAEVIGLIPRILRPSPVTGDRGDLPPRLREPFRRLRTVLALASTETPTPIRTLLVTSASPREGKSTVARNLALAFQEAGARVLLVDSDLRKPALDRLLPVSREPGLVDVLVGSRNSGEAIGPDDALQPVAVSTQGLEELHRATAIAVAQENGDRDTRTLTNGSEPHAALHVLASGRTVSNPIELLSTRRMRSVLRALADDYDMVIIDTPPLANVSDAITLMPEVDAVLLVGQAGRTRRDAADNVRTQLRRLPNVRVLGVVANRVPSTQFRARGYGGRRRRS